MHSQARKAVFLDRDGVLVRERGDYNYLPSHFSLNRAIVPDLRWLAAQGYLLLVITNQSGIAKGIYTHGHVRRFHRRLHAALLAEGVTITDFFYCPHHPSVSSCLCRKPAPGLYRKAMAMYHIDPDRSLAFGDQPRDVEAARAAGIRRAFLVPANPASLRAYIRGPEGNRWEDGKGADSASG